MILTDYLKTVARVADYGTATSLDVTTGETAVKQKLSCSASLLAIYARNDHAYFCSRRILINSGGGGAGNSCVGVRYFPCRYNKTLSLIYVKVFVSKEHLNATAVNIHHFSISM